MFHVEHPAGSRAPSHPGPEAGDRERGLSPPCPAPTKPAKRSTWNGTLTAFPRPAGGARSIANRPIRSGRAGQLQPARGPPPPATGAATATGFARSASSTPHGDPASSTSEGRGSRPHHFNAAGPERKRPATRAHSPAGGPRPPRVPTRRGAARRCPGDRHREVSRHGENQGSREPAPEGAPRGEGRRLARRRVRCVPQRPTVRQPSGRLSCRSPQANGVGSSARGRALRSRPDPSRPVGAFEAEHEATALPALLRAPSLENPGRQATRAAGREGSRRRRPAARA